MLIQVSNDVMLVSVIHPSELGDYRRRFNEVSSEFPEFKQEAFTPMDTYVLGSFGAYGNPASFHNPFVRSIRDMVHPEGKKALRHIYGEHSGKMFHQLYDRMCKRPAGSSYQGEAWHRDVASGFEALLPEDHIWGGWLNLDSSQQLFTCVLNSAVPFGQGFARQGPPPERDITTVKIDPGWMILFRQDILHTVHLSKFNYDSYRLFIGWRVTSSQEPLYDVEDIIQRQTVPPLPSGQYPPMFSAMHDSALLHKKTIPWSDRLIHDFVKDLRTVGGDPKMVCPRFIRRGLVDMGKAYIEYFSFDRDIFFPRLL